MQYIISNKYIVFFVFVTSLLRCVFISICREAYVLLMSLSIYSLRINLLNVVVVGETISARFVTPLKVINVTIPTTDY